MVGGEGVSRRAVTARREEDVDGAVGGDRPGTSVDLLVETALEAVEVEAEPEDLAVAAEAADDLEQSVGRAGEVAGAQLVVVRPWTRSAGASA